MIITLMITFPIRVTGYMYWIGDFITHSHNGRGDIHKILKTGIV